jgi:hypothetical protein
METDTYLNTIIYHRDAARNARDGARLHGNKDVEQYYDGLLDGLNSAIRFYHADQAQKKA